MAPTLLKVGGMDLGLAIVLVIFVPLLPFAFVVRTRFAWVPGALLMIGGCVLFGTIEPVHDDIGGMGAMANGVLALASLGLCFYGLVLLVLGSLLSRKPARRQPAQLPVATVVAGGVSEGR